MAGQAEDTVIGIDLGTTNSEVAALCDGRVKVLGSGDGMMLPSCVGLSPEGELLVGRPALNQHTLHPERTLRSIKRKMGSAETVKLGDRELTPQEVSAIILRALVATAERELGARPRRAVITVPAYFSEAQRQATREAGELAGLEVLRILNEPTAASLAYGLGAEGRQTVLVYDLGGGTFDVSLVTLDGEVTEVLASHGNNRLGGDDFDRLLADHVARGFGEEHGVDFSGAGAVARSRLWHAAEQAKRRLSFEPYATLREDSLMKVKGRALHLEREVSRQEYEGLIGTLVDGTLDSVSKALADAGKTASELDGILLVGGSTRTPLIARLLEERTGLKPRCSIHPDLCVALGAGVLASRLGGQSVAHVLVDVSPFSFGPSHLGLRGGLPYRFCYHPIIERNTPLPVTRTDIYCTAYDNQEAVDLRIYQGEDEDALRNLPVGAFRMGGLTKLEGPNEVLCRMSLDVDGLLHVTATEKRTGKSAHITIDNALRPRSAEELAAARRRLEELVGESLAAGEELYVTGNDEDGDEEWAAEVAVAELGPAAAAARVESDAEGAPHADPAWAEAEAAAQRLLKRSRALLAGMHAEDREEAIDLNESVEKAIEELDVKLLEDAVKPLRELLFFVDGVS